MQGGAALADAEAKVEALKSDRMQADSARISAEARASEARAELDSTREELHAHQKLVHEYEQRLGGEGPAGGGVGG